MKCVYATFRLTGKSWISRVLGHILKQSNINTIVTFMTFVYRVFAHVAGWRPCGRFVYTIGFKLSTPKSVMTARKFRPVWQCGRFFPILQPVIFSVSVFQFLYHFNTFADTIFYILCFWVYSVPSVHGPWYFSVTIILLGVDSLSFQPAT